MNTQDKWSLAEGDLVEVWFPGSFLSAEVAVGFISRIATLPNGGRTMRLFLATGKTYAIEEDGRLDHLSMKVLAKAKQ